MLSPNQLYDYLRYYCITNKKNVELLHFAEQDQERPVGLKNLRNLVHAGTPYIPEDLQTHLNMQELTTHRETGGTMTMFDQEPLDINAYCIITKESIKQDNSSDVNKHVNLHNDDFFLYRSKGIYNPIIAVSEINSNDVARVTNNSHIPFYFWSNAFLSRYWYSMYEMLFPTTINSKNRFGCYIRDVTGTRKYRKNILQMLENSNIDVYCPILNNTIELSSDLSATIDWVDQSKFDIHIVPETIFNTEKVHLTEKIFKPIVMYQPFILFGGPYSLKYLRSYGFKTFSELWNESYDCEENTDARFKKITDLISYLNNLNPMDYKKLIRRANKIAEFNKEHFYSDKFYKILKSELHNNLNEALHIREEQFHTNPGGTLFYFDNLYFNKFGVKPRKGVDHKNALEYAYSKSKSVGDAIVKKYSHLL
jgi:hypothetical protein